MLVDVDWLVLGELNFHLLLVSRTNVRFFHLLVLILEHFQVEFYFVLRAFADSELEVGLALILIRFL